MQDIEEIILLSDAVMDLDQGRQFYDKVQRGVGNYFYDSLISDIESLHLYAGIHPNHHGYHYMLSHRFPFAIYYEINDNIVIIIAVLDMRRNPVWIREQLDDRQ